MSPKKGESNLAALQAEVVALRDELAAIKRLLGIDPGTEAASVPTLNPVFGSLRIGTEPAQAHILLELNEHGGALRFQDAEGRDVALLSQNGGAGYLLLQQEGEKRVEIDIQQEHGRLWAFGPGGAPSASVKSTPHGGLITVTNQRGDTQAFLGSGEHGGEIKILDRQQKVAASMAGAEQGGNVCVHDPRSGKPRVIVGTVETAQSSDGFLLVLGEDSKARVHLGVIPDGGTVAISNNSQATVAQMTATSQGGWMEARRNSGNQAAALVALDAGGAVFVSNAAGEKCASVHAEGDVGHLTVSKGGRNAATVGVNDLGGFVFVYDQNSRPAAMLHVDSNGGCAAVVPPGALPAALLHITDSGHGAVTVSDGHGEVRGALFSREQGGQVTVFGQENVALATMTSGPDGGEIAVHNDFGIERASLSTFEDGGALKLNWAGALGLFATATEDCGRILFYDRDENVVALIPVTEEMEEEEDGDDLDDPEDDGDGEEN